MIILGLGSNLGDRLENLRQAFRLLKHLPELTIQRVSPLYISDALTPEHAPHNWNLPFINLAICCETTLQPLVLLEQIKNIEVKLGRNLNAERWSPRIIDIDILAWDNIILQHEKLTLPHPELLQRPFALWPLADVAPFWILPSQNKTAAELVENWGSRFTGKAPFHTHQIQQRIDTPQLVGILNITPDSYSDGGQFLHTEYAIKQMLHLVQSGAEVIDIGAESTSPVANAITIQEEWARLAPVLAAVQTEKNKCVITPKISIDTRHSEVAEKALALDIDWINDVSGLDDTHMRDVVANTTADCVIMHHLSIPERRDNVLPRNENPSDIVYAWLTKRLAECEQHGIARSRIIVDPGIGFGKMAEQSLHVLQNINLFKTLGVRILIGHSRKSFLSLFTDKPHAERDAETMAMTLAMVKHNVDYIRVHNVEICARGLKAYLQV